MPHFSKKSYQTSVNFLPFFSQPTVEKKVNRRLFPFFLQTPGCYGIVPAKEAVL